MQDLYVKETKWCRVSRNIRGYSTPGRDLYKLTFWNRRPETLTAARTFGLPLMSSSPKTVPLRRRHDIWACSLLPFRGLISPFRP